jgi:hypothetical protein
MKTQLQTQNLLLAAFKGLGPENKNQGQEIQALKAAVLKQRLNLPNRPRWGEVGSFSNA